MKFLREEGLEPSRLGHQILSLACLPISPLSRKGRRKLAFNRTCAIMSDGRIELPTHRLRVCCSTS